MFDYVEQYEEIQRRDSRRHRRACLASRFADPRPAVRALRRELRAISRRVRLRPWAWAMAPTPWPSPCGRLEIGPGDEVITVANTAIPTVSAIRMAGATPVFCDDRSAHAADGSRSTAESRITPRTRAIVPVHLFGNAVDMPRLVATGRAAWSGGGRRLRPVVRHDLAGPDDRHLRRRGLLFVLSDEESGRLWRRRILLHARSRTWPRRCVRFAPTAAARPTIAEREGVNSRLDELQAAMLDVKLRHLDDYLASAAPLPACTASTCRRDRATAHRGEPSTTATTCS